MCVSVCVCVSECGYATKSKIRCGFTLDSSPWSPLQFWSVSLKRSVQGSLFQGVSFWLHCFLVLIPSALWKWSCKTCYCCSHCCLRNSSRAPLISFVVSVKNKPKEVSAVLQSCNSLPFGDAVEQQNKYHLVNLTAQGVPAEAADAEIPNGKYCGRNKWKRIASWYISIYLPISYIHMIHMIYKTFGPHSDLCPVCGHRGCAGHCEVGSRLIGGIC